MTSRPDDGIRPTAPSSRSDLPTLIATVTGIVAFPLAGVLLLGHALSPLSFALFAAFAGCLVFVFLARLEPS